MLVSHTMKDKEKYLGNSWFFSQDPRLWYGWCRQHLPFLPALGDLPNDALAHDITLTGEGRYAPLDASNAHGTGSWRTSLDTGLYCCARAGSAHAAVCKGV